MQYSSRRLLFLISLGAILEYYDFAVFIYLAPTIGKSLIPVNNPTTNLILSYAIFAIGALCRPLGGVIFSHIGDTRGRSRTFIYTILFMALPTLCIALIPNISVIGIWATVLLLLFRILQGFAIGGEVPGSIVFGYEVSPPQHRAMSSAVILVGINIGFVLASATCTAVLMLSFSAFASWRIAFVFGGVLGLCSYFLRKKIVETPEFEQYKKLVAIETVPLKQLFCQYQKPIWQLLGIGAFLASTLAVFTFYMPTYLSYFYHFPMHELIEFNSYTIVIFIFGSLLAGYCDKYFGKKFFTIFIPVFIVVVLALFPAYAHLTLQQILVLHLFVLLAIGIVCGRLPVWCAAFFPVSVRYTGVALVYNLCFGVVAGSTQMLLTWLIKLTGIIWLPAIYLLVFGVLAMFSVLSVSPQQLVTYD